MRTATLLIACGLTACGAATPERTEPAPVVGSCPAQDAPDGVHAVLAWQADSELSGLQEGSPALCDLDEDGQPELIAPIAPPPPARARIQVHDAVNGTLKWQTRLLQKDDFGTPLCVDADADGDLDVLTSGRSGDVRALDGRTGDVLWTLSDGDESFLAGGNTYSVVPVGERLLVVQGGGGGPAEGGIVAPDVPGRLLLFARSGGVLGSWPAPDDEEMYGTPAVLATDTGWRIAVGTGGERLGGSIHLLDLDRDGSSFTARGALRSSCETGGFISSPMFGDLDGDDVSELVAVDFCGTVHAAALDGTVRWTATSDIPYGTSNPLLADLDGDGRLDVVAAFESLNISFREQTAANPTSLIGAWRGTDGAPLWSHTTPGWIFASPVSADLDGDGTEDVVLPETGAGAGGPRLVARSGRTGEVLYQRDEGETASTPVLADVDADGHLDLLYVDALPDDGAVMPRRLEFCGVPHDANHSWSGFRGSRHDGVRAAPGAR
ncbi:MAG: hypothetical protein EP330_05475 [Deltaproteobacteria bacterium]|nr:MAG: hypothetical protein EP330_05475 [Deltaproteobacteria bacterium]